jgi:hypothetical protein
MLPAFALFAAAQTPAPESAWLINLESQFVVIGYEDDEAPRLQFPLPLDYRDQVPVSFTYTVTPADKVAKTAIFTTPTGDQIFEVTFKPMKREEKIDMSWRAKVLARVDYKFDGLPKTAAIPAEYPREAQQWLRPSKYVQSSNSKIVDEARSFRSNNVIQMIDRTMSGAKRIMGRQEGMCADLGAVEALTKQGSCTSNANLLAALLRANKIPARVLSGYPTWSGPLQTHYIVEAYIDGFGWYPLESTLSEKAWPAAQMPLVSIISVDNESKGDKRLSGYGGVPFLSLTETLGKIVARGTMPNYCDHVAAFVKRFDLAPTTWTDQEARWATWLKESKREVKELPVPETF